MDRIDSNILEILAPVGSMDSLFAAIQNGANAVYLGGKEFSARSSANNFDKSELKEALSYAHIRGCKVFVTVNTIIKQDEVDSFLDYILFLEEVGVDAVIIQDIGMASTIHKKFPNLELHASTQMAAHSLKDVLFLQEIGFKRVVLARELNIDEIREITKKSSVDIEVFVHGALCVSYSGQCLMSSTLGTRSGNRGRCAQPCRQKYKILNIETGEYHDTKGEFLLSPRDINTIEEIGRIVDAGVYSLKIEGRMKRPEYVATVVSSYRKAVLNYLKNKNEGVSNRDLEDLYTIFNRQFTKSYVLGEIGEDIMNPVTPKNIGLYIGRAVGYNKKKKRLKISLEKSLKKGDGLNIGGGNIGRIIKNGKFFDIGYPGEIVEIDFVGTLYTDAIYKTSDNFLMDKVKKTYEKNIENIKIPVKCELVLKIGENPRIMLDDGVNRVEYIGERVVEKAINVPLDKERVIMQVSKLGDLPYEIDNISIDIQEGISLPISEINKLRRSAFEKLSEKRAKKSGTKGNINMKNILSMEEKTYSIEKNTKMDIAKNSIFNENVDKIGESTFLVEDVESKKEMYYSLTCKNLDELKSNICGGKRDLCAGANTDSAIYDAVYYKDIDTLNEAVEISKSKNKKIYYYFPRIIRTFEDGIYKRLIDKKRYLSEGLDGFRVSSYGELLFVRENFPDREVLISPWMNIINDESIRFYKKLGASKVCLSHEMSLYQMKKLSKDVLDVVEYSIFYRPEMMISEYCPMGVLVKNCKRDKRDVLCNKSTYYLESRTGDKFRLSQDKNCRTTIFADEVVDLRGDIDKLVNIGVENFEVVCDFNDMDQRFSTGHLYKEID